MDEDKWRVDHFYTIREENQKKTFWNNIVSIQHSKQQVLEYYGSTLSHNLPTTLDLKLNYIQQLIAGSFRFQISGIEVAHLHKLHILHRDLKPSNILVQNNRLKVCDFGCSKIIEGTSEQHRSTPLVTSRFYR